MTEVHDPIADPLTPEWRARVDWASRVVLRELGFVPPPLHRCAPGAEDGYPHPA